MTPTQEQIKIAWDALYNRVIHKTNPPDKLLENFGTLYDAWQTASAKTLSPTEMTKWAARYSEQLVLVEGWERVYPVAQKSNVKTGTGKVTELAPTNVTGALPWWYWPLRVSAGIGAGYVVYRTLRPGQKPQSMRSTYRPTFAGLSNIPDRGPERPSGQGWKKVPSVMSGGKPFFWYRNEGGNRQTYMWNRQTQRWEYSFGGTSRESLGDAMNREGMTWEEWRNAALSDGSKSHKAAWRRGEDPTEHRLDDDPSPRSGHRDDRWS